MAGLALRLAFLKHLSLGVIKRGEQRCSCFLLAFDTLGREVRSAVSKFSKWPRVDDEDDAVSFRAGFVK